MPRTRTQSRSTARGTASPTIRATIANTLPAGDVGNATVSFTLTPIGPARPTTAQSHRLDRRLRMDTRRPATP
jgi:hypothetical protein